MRQGDEVAILPSEKKISKVFGDGSGLLLGGFRLEKTRRCPETQQELAIGGKSDSG